MSNSTKPNDRWEACPPRLLGQLAADLAAQDRWQDRKMLMGRSVTACLLIVVVGGVVIWSAGPGYPGSLTCVECRNHFEAYRQQLALGQPILPDDTFHQVEYHLDHCGSCRTKFSELYPEALASIGVPNHWTKRAPVLGLAAVLATLLP